MRERLHSLVRLSQILLIRYTPLSKRAKERILWTLSPRYRLGVHAVILDNTGRALSLLSSYSNEWQLPGGTVDYGEDLDTAMRREAREELGVEPLSLQRVAFCTDDTGKQLHAVYLVTIDPAHIHLSIEHTRWRYQSSVAFPPFYGAIVRAVLTGALSDRPAARLMRFPA